MPKISIINVIDRTVEEREMLPEEIVSGQNPGVHIVTMRQARLALLQQGLLPQVQTAINSLPSPQKEAAQIEWDYSSEVHRDKPFVQLLGSALGLSDEQLDSLFELASTL